MFDRAAMRDHVRCRILLLSAALVGCSTAAPRPERVETTVSAAPPPVASSAEPVAPQEPRRARTPEELREVHRMLREADEKLAKDDAAGARKLYEAGWQLMRPNPLALALAADAAARAGDLQGADALLARAHEEAKTTPGGCEKPEMGFGRREVLEPLPEPGAVWHQVEGNWVRFARGWPQGGFCGNATHDPVLAPESAVAWAPRGLAVQYDFPPVEGTPGAEVEVTEPIYGEVRGRIKLSFKHGHDYDGAIAIDGDGKNFAVAGDRVVAVFRASDLVRLYEVPFPEAHQISYSPDGALLVVGGCSKVNLYRAETGKLHASIAPPHVQCVYGAGVEEPIGSPVFSPDLTLLAFDYIVAGPPMSPPPRNEEGHFTAIFRVKDGSRLRRFKDPPLERLARFSEAGDKLLRCHGGTQDVTTGNRTDPTIDEQSAACDEHYTDNLREYGPYLLPKEVPRFVE